MEGIHIRSFLALISIVVLLLSACSSSNRDDIQIQNNTSEDPTKVEELLASNEHVRKAVVLFNEKELLTAVRMNTFSRFNKRSIGKKIEEKLEKLYPNMSITVSVDNKILLETKKLIDAKGEKDEKAVGKKIKQLKSLIKEET